MDSRIHQYLSLWEQSQRKLSPEELCRDQPDCTEEVRRCIQQLQSVDNMLESDLPSDESPDPVQVGGYRVVERIGRGGMGVVYKAEQANPSRLVALKLIRSGLSAPALLRRFRREAEVLGKLQHPCIAQIHEASTAEVNGRPTAFFAMEYIQGEPIDVHCRQGQLRVRHILELMAMVCDAVHYAHHQGIIHRDLKPANILVDTHGRPRILDFGVARLTNSDVHATTVQTEVGQIVGTLAYMAPEQASGDPAAIDARADVYALGATLYELLSGHLPIDLGNCPLPEVVRRIQDQPIAPASSIDRAFRGDMDAILAKALEKDPTRRYATAEALGNDLRSYLDRMPISAGSPSRLYRAVKFSQRHRASMALGAGLILAAVGISGFFLRGWMPREKENTPPGARGVGPGDEDHRNVAATAGATSRPPTRPDVPDISGTFMGTWSEDLETTRTDAPDTGRESKIARRMTLTLRKTAHAPYEGEIVLLKETLLGRDNRNGDFKDASWDGKTVVVVVHFFKDGQEDMVEFSGIVTKALDHIEGRYKYLQNARQTGTFQIDRKPPQESEK